METETFFFLWMSCTKLFSQQLNFSSALSLIIKYECLPVWLAADPHQVEL